MAAVSTTRVRNPQPAPLKLKAIVTLRTKMMAMSKVDLNLDS
jgi:hypothetical protein